MRNYTKCIKIISSCILIVGLISLSVYNTIVNGNFFETSVHHIISIVIAIVFAYYFAQKNNEDKKRKEIIEIILERMQKSIIELRSYHDKHFDCETTAIRQQHRNMSNKINMLKEIGDRYKLNNDVDYILDEFTKYKTEVWDLSPNVEALRLLIPKFNRMLNNIEEKCDQIIVKLYK